MIYSWQPKFGPEPNGPFEIKLIDEDEGIRWSDQKFPSMKEVIQEVLRLFKSDEDVFIDEVMVYTMDNRCYGTFLRRYELSAGEKEEVKDIRSRMVDRQKLLREIKQNDIKDKERLKEIMEETGVPERDLI